MQFAHCGSFSGIVGTPIVVALQLAVQEKLPKFIKFNGWKLCRASQMVCEAL
jgi:hypothetical protein